MVVDPGAPAGDLQSATPEQIWSRLSEFLDEVVPVAEKAGVTLAAHPDDPPMPTLRRFACADLNDEVDRIRSLVSDRGYDRSQAFLRSLGQPATPFIKEAAAHDGSPKVRERAAELLGSSGRGWPSRSSSSTMFHR